VHVEHETEDGKTLEGGGINAGVKEKKASPPVV